MNPTEVEHQRRGIVEAKWLPDQQRGRYGAEHRQQVHEDACSVRANHFHTAYETELRHEGGAEANTHTPGSKLKAV